MIRFHWIVKDKPDPDGLRDLIQELDEVGYKSALFVFGQYVPDNSVLVARALGQNQTMKLMFAVRPHALTPMYSANIISAYEQIAPGRFMFNIVAGTYDDYELLFDSKSTREERKVYAGTFIEEVRRHSTVPNFPKVVFSGSSEATVKNVRDHGDVILMHIDDYIKNTERFANLNKEKMVRAWISIGDTEESAKSRLLEITQDEKEIANTLCGTYESIIKEIDALEAIGVTDILISDFKGTSRDQVHKLTSAYFNR